MISIFIRPSCRHQSSQLDHLAQRWLYICPQQFNAGLKALHKVNRLQNGIRLWTWLNRSTYVPFPPIGEVEPIEYSTNCHQPNQELQQMASTQDKSALAYVHQINSAIHISISNFSIKVKIYMPIKWSTKKNRHTTILYNMARLFQKCLLNVILQWA